MKKDFYVEVENKDQANEVKRLAEGCGLKYDPLNLGDKTLFHTNGELFWFTNKYLRDHPTYSFSNPAWRKLLLPEKYAVEVGNWEEEEELKFDLMLIFDFSCQSRCLISASQRSASSR